MGRVFFALLLVWGTLASAADFLVITDIDDTLKDAYVLSTVGKIRRGIQTDRAFPRMPELLRTLADSGAKVIYVSAAPEFLMRAKHAEFLSENRFPEGDLHLSPTWVRSGNKGPVLRKILEEERPKFVVFLGDNGEKDPILYSSLVLENPEIRFYTFIRWVYPTNEGSPFYDGQTPFITAGEVALSLYQAGLMLPKPARKLVRDSVSRGLFSEIKDWIMPGTALGLPRWIECEGMETNAPAIPEWQEDIDLLFEKIRARCDGFDRE